MANLDLLVVESSGKQKRKPSSSNTVDFLSIKVGASGLEILEASGHFDMSAKKLTNVAAGGAAGEVLIYDQRGAALGVASLDAGGKVPVSQLPSAVMTYEGVWSAALNLPHLSNSGIFAALNLQDLKFQADAAGAGGNAISIEYTSGGTAGSEVVSVLSNAISVQIESGVSTATQVKAAIDGFPAAAALVDVSISGTGSNAQVTVAATSLAGGNAIDAGMVYRVGSTGSVDFGAGAISFVTGDYAIYNSSGLWEKSDTTDAVASVNGFTGVVSLTTSNISEGTNLYFTDERAQDAVGNNLLDTASVNLTYNDGTGQISADVLPAGVDHDSLQNFVANEHIDHSSVSINTAANSGLSGGGDLTASRSLVIDPSNAPSVSAALGDSMLISDVSDSGNLKKITVQSILDLAGVGAEKSFVNDNAGTISAGQIVYIKSNGNMDLALAGTAAIADGQLAIVKDASILSAASGVVYVKDGEIIGGFSGLTIGAKLFVSRAAAGSYTQSLSGFVAGEMVYCIGRAISATEIVFDPEFEFEF